MIPSAAPAWWWWLWVAAATAGLLWLVPRIDIALQLDLAIILILALLALSMSFLWGYVGMLSFGQTAFFGLGGYAYAILALNLDATTLPALAAILLAMLFAAVLGYLMIYGLVSDIYFSVITLVVTLILEKGIRSTSGPEYVIGSGAPQRPERHPGRAVAPPALGSHERTVRRRRALSRDRAAGRWSTSACGCCWSRASAACWSASARTSGASICSATTAAPTGSRPSCWPPGSPRSRACSTRSGAISWRPRCSTSTRPPRW